MSPSQNDGNPPISKPWVVTLGLHIESDDEEQVWIQRGEQIEVYSKDVGTILELLAFPRPLESLVEGFKLAGHKEIEKALAVLVSQNIVVELGNGLEPDLAVLQKLRFMSWAQVSGLDDPRNKKLSLRFGDDSPLEVNRTVLEVLLFDEMSIGNSAQLAAKQLELPLDDLIAEVVDTLAHILLMPYGILNERLDK